MSDELCGFHGVKGARERGTYECLGAITTVGATSKKGINRPAIVKDAAKGHGIILNAIKKSALRLKKQPLKTVTVKGIYGACIGLVIGESVGAPVFTKPLTPKQKKALDRFNKFATAAQKKDAAARKSLANAVKKTVALHKGVKQTAGKHVTLKRQVVRMHGFIGADPDPNNPGFLTDGSPDPAFWGDDAGGDPAISETANTPITQPVPMDQAPRVVGDGIKYDGAKGWPKNQFGSKSYFDSNGEWGYVWGWDKFPAGFFVDTTKARWVCVGGRNSMSVNGLNWWDVLTQDPSAAESTANIEALSMGGQIPKGQSAGSPSGTFGPLVGTGDFAGLQWATEDKAWFWHPSRAPDWATVEIRNEAALRQKEIDDAAKAAQQAAADAAAKTQADQEAQAAQLEFELSLKEAAAASEAGIEAQKQATAQAQSEQEQAAAQAKMDQQAQQQQLDLQQAQIAYYQQHPEALAQQQTPQGYGDEGYAEGGDYGAAGDEGYADSGERPEFGPGPDDPLAGVPYSMEEQ